ncbi:ornithine cyclodeaminase family protein [Streptomyces sp. NPDC001851]|uniref:ornithine cyclodeaminase family protein n=1 Tax=Streptomyces sp. NPDC001851 TaxID=3154529 RepID=UPI003329F3BE
MEHQTLVLGQSDIHRIVDLAGRDRVMDEMIDRLHSAFSAARSGKSVTPARQGFLTGTRRTGVLEWMPHHDIGSAITVKTVSYAPENPNVFGLPTILGTMARFDDETGHLLALSDGVLPTAIRTGAASAVATRLLAHPESRVVGLIGAGAQAVTQVHALSRVLPIDEVLVHDVDDERSHSLPKRLEFLGLDVRVAAPDDIESRADVICTATSVDVGDGPVLTGTRLKAHAHINAIGADLPGKVEIPAAVLKDAFVCPDHLEQAMREGECQQLAPEDIGPSILELASDPSRAEPLRFSRTVFDSTGFALEDHVAFDVFHDFAQRFGVGQRIRLESVPSDVLNPYDPVPAIEWYAETCATVGGDVPGR